MYKKVYEIKCQGVLKQNKNDHDMLGKGISYKGKTKKDDFFPKILDLLLP